MGISKQAAQKRFGTSLPGVDLPIGVQSRLTPRVRRAGTAARGEALAMGLR
jgi:hypothetical protein